MQMPRGTSKFGPDVRTNLLFHRYAEFADRFTFRYIGAPRINDLGRPIDERAFSLKRMSTLMAGAIMWTKERQAQAVRRGFFLHRSNDTNKVNIVQAKFQADLFDSFNGYDASRWLERMAFRNPLDTVYHDALAFVKQQDQFGYSGAWDAAVQFWSAKLLWYKAWHAEDSSKFTRTTPHAAAVIAVANKRVETSTNAQAWAYGSRLRHWLRVGEDGVARPIPHTKAKVAPPRPVRGRPRTGDKSNLTWPGHSASTPITVEKPAPLKRTRAPLSRTFKPKPPEWDDGDT